jgi:uncharacterized protein (DUF924 family)
VQPRRPHFPSLAATGHRALDLTLPRGIGPLHPWRRREPWFPEGVATGPAEVLRTWFGAADQPVADFNLMGGSTPAWDQKIRQCYGPLWQQLRDGGLSGWEETPKGKLAKLILADQLPRHIFRGQPEAFSTDEIGARLADALADEIAAGAALHLEEAFMIAWPWVHAEDLDSTYRATWWHSSLAEAARGTPFHFRALLNRYGAERHVRVIQRFGRYPHRNVILGRDSTPEELHYLRHDAELWELQQSSRHGTFFYKLKAAAFFVRNAVYLIGAHDGDAITTFLAGCLRSR